MRWIRMYFHRIRSGRVYRHSYLRGFWSEIGKYFICMGIGCMTYSQGVSQVLNCEVQVTADVQLGNVLDQERIEDLSKGMSDYLNNTAWTRDEFLPYERIKCTMVLNIKSASSTGQYGGSMQILSLRPVYGATYETPLLNFTEDWNFTYNVGQPLRYTLSGTMEELEALLAFYAYLMLGLDYDFFFFGGGHALLSASTRGGQSCPFFGEWRLVFVWQFAQ